MKLLLLSAGFKGFSTNFNKALLNKGIDVDFVEGSQQALTHDYPFPETPNLISTKEVEERMPDYDYVLFADHGILSTVDRFIGKTKAKFILQILDVPSHLFNKNNSYYEPTIVERWSWYVNDLPKFHKIIFNQKASLDEFDFSNSGVETCVIPFPVNPIYIEPEKYTRQNYVLYIGRNSLDKGVFNIINAMALLKNKPKLVTISNGPYNEDIANYAKYMRIDHENIPDCPEYKKWVMLHECLFTVLGATTPNIPPLLTAEGFSIGRTGVCFDFPEFRRAYKDYVLYAQPFNTLSFATEMERLINDKNLRDTLALKGIEDVKNNRSYDYWAEQVLKFIGE